MHDCDVRGGQGGADGAALVAGRVGADVRGGTKLGHAVGLLHTDTEAIFNCDFSVGTEGSSAAEQALDGGQVVAGHDGVLG